MKKNNKGFTLAELLIVVAIIAVLVAIAIPIFTQQLERAREATDLANIRSAYAEAMTDFLVDGKNEVIKTASIKQQDADWHIDHTLTTRIDGVEGTIDLDPVVVGGAATVTVTPPTTGSTAPTVAVTFGAATSGGGTSTGGDTP